MPGPTTCGPSIRFCSGGWIDFGEEFRRGLGRGGNAPRFAKPSRVLMGDSGPVAGLPLDGATHRRQEGRGRLLVGEESVEDLPHHLLPDRLRVLRVIELSAVPELSGSVEHEEIRCA